MSEPSARELTQMLIAWGNGDRTALERLAPLERAVLLLRGVGEFSYKEIHELLAIPVGSVIGYLSRARKRLRIMLAEYAKERGLFPHKQS